MLGIDRHDGGRPMQQQYMTSSCQDMPMTLERVTAAAARSLRMAIIERAARERRGNPSLVPGRRTTLLHTVV